MSTRKPPNPLPPSLGGKGLRGEVESLMGSWVLLRDGGARRRAVETAPKGACGRHEVRLRGLGLGGISSVTPSCSLLLVRLLSAVYGRCWAVYRCVPIA